MKDYGIYVELDTLLDTRLGTVSYLDPQAGRRLFADPAYYTRECDDWLTLTQGVITQETFDTTYAQRDTTILQHALVTALPTYLAEMVRDYHQRFYYDVEFDRVVVEVNIHPYVLSVGERDTLLASLRTLLQNRCVVKLISLPPSLVTLPNIKQRWRDVFIYHFDQWVHYQGEQGLLEHGAPESHLYVAQLYHSPPKEAFHSDRLHQTPFEITEKLLLPCINVNFLPAYVMSVMRPDDIMPEPEVPASD